ncbi:MAG: penicillin-binding protein 2 [bacterium]
MVSYKKFHQKKITFISITFAFFFILAFLTQINWQVFNKEQFIAIANERYREIKIPSVRGSIKAKDGSTLAYSEPRFDVFVWLQELQSAEDNGTQTREEFLTKVSTAIGVDSAKLSEQLSGISQWIKIGDKISVEQRNTLLNLKKDKNSENYLQGFQLQYVNKRNYPENNLASHVVGFLGLNQKSEPKGIGGLEQYWDGSLKPFEGFETGEYDSFGNPITLNSQTQLQAKEGVTLYTTIDKILQEKIAAKLQEGVERFQAKSGSAILMNPKTGEIMAIANVPDYDPNNYAAEKNGDVFSNLAITVPYEIGSVAKVFTLSAALDLGKVQPQTVILPSGHQGCEVINPNPDPGDNCKNFESNPKVDCICTWDKKPYLKSINIIDGLVNSDNIAFRHIAMTMTYQEFYTYLDRFGAGKLTGIDIAGESTGTLIPSDQWNYADQAVYSYGHGYQITPLQAIVGVAAVANDGQRMQPYVVSQITSKGEETTKFNPRKVAEVITPETSQKMIDIMHEVYRKSLVEPRYKSMSKYYIAMKSGTALVPYKDRPGYSSEINATYVGFDASPERKFILLIKLEEPQVGFLSTMNARFVWLDTFNEIKDYLGVPVYEK